MAVRTSSEEARKRFDRASRPRPGGRPAPASTATGPLADVTPIRREPAAAPAVAAEPVPDASELGITDYDVLSASQVVPRLAGLHESELDAVRRYEAAHRGRKTILSKIAQLQG
jgi:hypothetical protein